MTTQEIAAACRKKYGEAHDAHMAINDECPWCGLAAEDDA